jgi:oxygen-dependent protoporphyrinogen oxidase
MRVGVIGAGPSGLAVAWELLARGRARGLEPQVEVYERAARPGGNVWTDAAQGYQIEQGPEGFLDSAPRTLELIGELQLGARVVSASDTATARFVYADGRLHPVPLGPIAFLRSALLPLPARLRVLTEPFRRAGADADETVLAFATRRLGPVAAERLVGAMVAGVYAGDAAALSMPAAFPRLATMERAHGSLTRALLATRRAARRAGRQAGGPGGPSGRLTSFAGGMGDVIHALARALGDRVHLDHGAVAVEPAAKGWRVQFDDAEEVFDRVVVTAPPWYAARLLDALDHELATTLEGIPGAPIAAVALGFDAAALAGVNVNGFGFLVPKGQGLRILGSLWSSSIFAGRAPAGRVLLRTLVGGARDPQAGELEDDRLLELVQRDLATAMGIRVAPDFVRIYRHPKGIPQYTLGHLARLEAIRKRLDRLPGLLLHGNGYRGISLNDCIHFAGDVADAALDWRAVGSLPAPASALA